MISERIKLCRKKCKLSQTVVANQLNITRQAYNHYETGKRIPPTEAIIRMSELFGVPTDYILGITDDPTSSRKEDTPETGSPEWLRSMFQRIGIDVEKLSDKQVQILKDNAGSLAKMLQNELDKLAKK